MTVKRLTFVISLGICLCCVSPLFGQERERLDYNEYYRFPFSVAVEYQSLSPFDDYGATFNIFEASLTGRVPLAKIPELQVQGTAGYIRFDSWDEVLPDRWDHYHLFGGAGIAFSARFTRDFEMGTDVVLGFSEAVFPSLDDTGAIGAPYFFTSLGGHVALDPSYNISVSLHPKLRYQRCLLWDTDFSDFDGFTLSLGAAIHYRFGDDPDSSRGIIRSLTFEGTEIPPLFAAMQSYYADHSFGSVSMKNTEKVRVDDVTVSFFQAGMMDAPTVCCSFSTIAPGEFITADLKAAFNQEVFRTEGVTPMTGEVIVQYTMRGRPAEQRLPVSYDLHDKTAIVWDDDARAAAFITPADSALRNYMSFIKGAAREYGAQGWSPEVQTAIQVFHALTELGLLYQVDPTSPFSLVAGDIMRVDSVSLPRDTLRRTSGDCDDLTILYASLLESVGIKTGFITIPGHIFPIFDTGIPVQEYTVLHPQRDMAVSLGDTLWIPVEITMLGEGSFLDAWRKGAEEWNACAEDPSLRNLVRTADAQGTYRPVSLRESDLGLQYGDEDTIAEAFSRDFAALQEIIIAGFVDRTRSKNRKQDYNALGVVYSRFGRFREAETAFAQAIRLDKNYLSPKVNRGNLAYLSENFLDAVKYYSQVLDEIGDSRDEKKSLAVMLLLNISKAYYGNGNFEEAKSYFEQAKALDPDAVKAFGYLGGTEGGGGARSADARSSGTIMFAEGEE